MLPVQTVTVGSNGTWTATKPSSVGDGAVSVTVSQFDGVGVEDTASLAFTLDSGAPAAPVDLDLAAGSDTGVSDTDNVTNANDLIISARPKLARRWQCSSAPARRLPRRLSQARWHLDRDAHGRRRRRTVHNRDGHGYGGQCLARVRTAGGDGRPYGAGTADAGARRRSDSGRDNADRETNAPTLVLTGDAEAGSTVEVFRDGISIGSTIAGAGGTWSFEDAVGGSILDGGLDDGDYEYSAVARDLAGNPSTESDIITVTLDRQAPSAAVLTTVVVNDATGSSVTLEGTSDDDSDVTLFEGTALEQNVVVDITETFSIPSSSLTGTQTLQVTARDAAGNPAAPSNAYTLTVGATGALLMGDTTADNFTGNTGNDTLVGGEGNDVLTGGAGNGNDVLDAARVTTSSPAALATTCWRSAMATTSSTAATATTS